MFEIQDQSNNTVNSYRGILKREECHQNLLVVMTPSVPFTEQVISQVVVVTSKKKMRSNSLPFTFIPAGTPSVKKTSQELSSFTVEGNKMNSPPAVSNSPQAANSSSPHSSSSSSDLTDVFTSVPVSPVDDDLSSVLDFCVQSLDMEAEEKILPTAILPANSLPMHGSLQLFGLA